MMINKTGSASVELVAIVPFFALAICLIFKFGIFFERSLTALEQAEAKVKRSALEWDRTAKGFKRPCLNCMEEGARNSTVTAEAVTLKMGEFQEKLEISEEVHLVGYEICNCAN